MTNIKINNPEEALELALRLTITAPTDEKAEEAFEMARFFASELAPADVEAIKLKIENEFQVRH